MEAQRKWNYRELRTVEGWNRKEIAVAEKSGLEDKRKTENRSGKISK